MYVRFISPWRLNRRGVDCGLFGPAGACEADPRVPEVLRRALGAEIDWFNRWLAVPPRRAFVVRSRKRWLSHGICWFVAEAREPIAHGFALAALLGECGVPVRKVATTRPGQILYRDAWQIVAKPVEATPTAWC
jgi:hypothetical protein